MCKPSVTKHHNARKPVLANDPAEKPLPDGWPVRAFCPIGDGSLSRTERRQADRQRVRDARLELPGRAEAAEAVYLLELCLSGQATQDRPAGSVPGLVLTSREELRRDSMVIGVIQCGTRWSAFRRLEVQADANIEYRLVAQLRCGTRACLVCDAEMRRREAARVAGPWKLFVTWGVPSGMGSVGECWRKIGRCLRMLLRKMRSHSKGRKPRHIRFDDSTRVDIAERNAALEDGARRLPLLQYAWCLEPHESGYPHVHFVTNASWIRYSWLRASWSKIIGHSCRWMYGIKVWSRDGVSSYLCKYLSKTSFPVELCAVMYRRRLWASTLPRGEIPEPIWTREDLTGGDAAADDASYPARWGVHQGWSVEMAKEGCYAIWSRVTQHVRDVSILDEICEEDNGQEWALRRTLDERPGHVTAMEWLESLKKPR